MTIESAWLTVKRLTTDHFMHDGERVVKLLSFDVCRSSVGIGTIRALFRASVALCELDKAENILHRIGSRHVRRQ